MSVALRKSDYFNTDFDLQYRWYLREGGEDVAEGYLRAVLATLNELTQHPGLGREREFRNKLLKGLRSMRVQPPYNRHLIFYRYTETELLAERVMHGMRDLPRRLRHPPTEKE